MPENESDILINEKSIDLLTVSTNFNLTSDSPNNRFTGNDENYLFTTEIPEFSQNTIIIDKPTSNFLSVTSSIAPTSRRPRRGIAVVPRDEALKASSQRYDSPDLAQWIDNDPNTPSEFPDALSSNLVKSNRAIILDPFQSQFESQGGDESDEVAATLEGLGFIVEKKVNTDVTIEDFKNLDQYGAIAIVSHGARVDTSVTPSLKKPGAMPIIYDNPNLNHPDKAHGQVVVLTGVGATANTIKTYQSDLVQKHLVQVDYNGLYLAITPSFITQYTPTLPNSLVYLGTCDSTYNDTLAQAFLSKGAGALVGYSRVVSTDFADRHGRAMFNAMAADRTTGEIPGINVDRDPHGALFDLAAGSDSDLTINIGLRNGHFEIGILSAWKPQGDAGVLLGLEPLFPHHGEKTACISTVEGIGSMSQSFFVPDNAEDLLFNYNLVSEEPPEEIVAPFDDQFDVLLRPDPINSPSSSESVTIFSTSTDNSLWSPFEPINLPGGNDTPFHTGFDTVSFDLTPWRGQRVNLLFEVFEQGETSYHTAALLDNIHITTV